MGEMINAICSQCGYESGTLMLGGGMMAVWSVSNSVACLCQNCKSIVCATVYMKPDEIEKEIEQILEKKECRWSGMTEDHEQAVKEIKKALKKSRKQQAEGIKCPECKLVKVEIIDRRKETKCPRCGKGIMFFEHVGCCD